MISKEFGCFFCAGTGYEDYPNNQIPCRYPEHVEAYKSHFSQAVLDVEKLRRNYKKADGPCPYCNKTVSCEHWTGLGWKRDVE